MAQGSRKEFAEATDTDIFEIKPETPYTDADLDRRDQNSRSSGFGNTVAEPKDSIDPTTVIVEGKLLNGSQSVDALREWVASLGL